MTTEYVRLTPPEQVYGETNLLQSEVSLLTMMQQYQEYESLRKEELFLKIELKKNIGEMKIFLDALAKVLPESNFEKEEEEKVKMQMEIVEKIEADVEKARKSEWRHWTEHEPRPVKIKPVREVKPKPIKVVKEAKPREPPKDPIERELEDINRRLAKLQ
jgi:hypothetical protein